MDLDNAAFSIGQKIGGASGAASSDFVKQLMLKEYGQKLQLQNAVISNGLGITWDKESKRHVFNENIYTNDNLKAVGLAAYNKSEEEAARQIFSDKIKLIGTVEKFISSYDSRVAKNPNDPLNEKYAERIDQLLGMVGVKIDLSTDEKVRTLLRDAVKDKLFVMEGEYTADPTDMNKFIEYKYWFSKYPEIANEMKLTDPRQTDITKIQEARETLTQKHERKTREAVSMEMATKQAEFRTKETQEFGGPVQEIVQKISKISPERAYAAGWRMNDDGSVYIDPVSNKPTKLPSFDDKMGKRGSVQAAFELGKYADDAKQTMELLRDKDVRKILGEAEREIGPENIWDAAKSKWSNQFRTWLTKKGFAANNKVTKAIARIQMLASIQRKEFLGAAVTAIELESITPWLPSAGDSYSTMMAKMELTANEADESFRQFLDVYKDEANMSPFYRAFGLKRFSQTIGKPNAKQNQAIKPKTANEYINKFRE